MPTSLEKSGRGTDQGRVQQTVEPMRKNPALQPNPALQLLVSVRAVTRRPPWKPDTKHHLNFPFNLNLSSRLVRGPAVSLDHLFFFMSVFVSQRERERDRQTDRHTERAPIHWFILPMPGPAKARIWGLNLALPGEWMEPVIGTMAAASQSLY